MLMWMISCSTSRPLQETEASFEPSSVDPATITDDLPDYRQELHSVRGKGRAIVSEPGNTERVTLLFKSNRQKSLVTVRSGIGIEGGQLLTDGDTLLIYNKVDQYVRQIPVAAGNLERINRLASLNLLEILNYTVSASQVRGVWENEDVFKLVLKQGTEVYINRKTKRVQRVVQPPDSDLPYSEIIYEAYASLEGFELPRRITIFGAGEKSKIALQLTSLELNLKLDPLNINIPDDIPVYNQ